MVRISLHKICSKRLIAWMAVVLFVGLLGKEQFERITLNREKAIKHAEAIMNAVCKEYSSMLDIKCENYTQFVEVERSARSFEFKWIYANDLELHVVVWDNGIFVDDIHSWWKRSHNADGSITLNPTN